MKDWERQERRVAKKVRGTLNAGSGSGWRRPNDVRTDETLHEMKQTGNKQITVKLDDWEKLRKNALLSGRRPLLHLEIGTRRLVVMDEEDYYDLTIDSP